MRVFRIKRRKVEIFSSRWAFIVQERKYIFNWIPFWQTVQYQGHNHFFDYEFGTPEEAIDFLKQEYPDYQLV